MSFNFPYGFNIGAVWTGGAAVEQAKASMSELPTMTAQWGQAAVQAGASYGRVMGSAIWSTQLLLMYGSFLYQNMIREELSTDALTTAQENYNDAVRDFGAGSEKAVDAAKQLEKAQLLVARANTMATLMTVSFGLQAVSTAIMIGKQLIPALLTWIETNEALTTSQILLQAMSGPAGWAALAGGLAVAGVVGYAVGQMNQTTINAPVNVTGGEKELDTALDKLNKKVKQDYRSQVGG